MAMSVNTSEKVRRTDVLMVSPFDILVAEEHRGRYFQPTKEKVVEMAMSIFDYSQRQPVECRRVTYEERKNVLKVTAGFTRTNAVRLIREGFTGTDGTHRHDPAFMIKVMVADCSDQRAFEHNIVENAHRNETSDIDDAHNQNRLRESYGYSDAEIARLYRYNSQNKVGRLRQLLQLTEEEQRLVHLGKLSMSAAIELLDLDENKRKEILIALQQGDENVKLKGSDVIDEVRNHILSDDDEGLQGDGNQSEVSNQKFKPRSMANLRKYLVSRQEEDQHPAVQRFCADMIKFLAGKSTDRAMDNAFKRMLEAEIDQEVKDKKAA